MVLKKDARAVLQFYPETSEQAVVIAQAASKVRRAITFRKLLCACREEQYYLPLPSVSLFAAYIIYNFIMYITFIRLVLRVAW